MSSGTERSVLRSILGHVLELIKVLSIVLLIIMGGLAIFIHLDSSSSSSPRKENWAVAQTGAVAQADTVAGPQTSFNVDHSPPPELAPKSFDVADVPLPDPLPPGFINMTDKTWHATLMGAKVGDKVRQDFTAVDLLLCANEKGYAAKKAAFAIKDAEVHQKKLDALIDDNLCSEIKWGELMVVTAVTPETVTLVDAAEDGTPNRDDRLHIFHKKSEPIDITPEPQITSANSDREQPEASQSSNDDNNALVFGGPRHIRHGGTMACVLRQALIQVVAIANEIGKHPERHATDAALDVAEKIGCRAIAEGTAIEIVDRVGPYVQYHEAGRAELLWTVSNFVGP